MNPVRMEFSRKINKKLIAEICKYIHMDKNHVFMSRVPLDLSFVFAIQNYLRMQGTAKENLFYQKRSPRMTPQLNDKQSLIAQIEQKDVLLSYPFELWYL